MSIADETMAARAASMIARWGKPAKLLRGGVLRDCVVARLEYNPRAKGLELEGAERALIAAPLDVPPDHEQDHLIMNGREYSIPLPVKGPRPGDVVIYYDAVILDENSYP